MRYEPIAAEREPPLLAGIELGGTKCVATLAAGPGRIVASETVPTGRPEQALPRLRAIVDGWIERYAVPAVGIAGFGPLRLDRAAADYGRVLATNKPGWEDADLIGGLVGGRTIPVAIDTDVNGAALAERCWGAAVGIDDFAYITVGTGVGVGLLVHGRPTRGIGHGELGHLRVPRLPDDHLPSGCRFHDDCVEGLAAGVGIQAALGGRDVAGLTRDDPVWRRVIAALGALCHAVVCASGPQRIALGGGVIERQPWLLPEVEVALRRSLNGYLALPPAPYLVPPALGAKAGPLGPIALAHELLQATRRASA